MNLEKVESSNIAEMGYNEEKEELLIVFHNNPDNVYAYRSVPLEVYNTLKSAESIGKCFHQIIRKTYPFDVRTKA